MNISILRSAAACALVGLLTLTACSEEKGSKASKAGTSISVPKYTKLEDVPESERKSLDAFGHEFEAELRASKFAAAMAKFHVAGTSEMIVEGINASPAILQKSRTDMEAGFRGS